MLQSVPGFTAPDATRTAPETSGIILYIGAEITHMHCKNFGSRACAKAARDAERGNEVRAAQREGVPAKT